MKATTNKSDIFPASRARADRATARGGVALRPNGPWRRSAPDRESGERLVAYVRSAPRNSVRSRSIVLKPQHEPGDGYNRRPRAGRSCVNAADVYPRSPRGGGYRASSGLNRAMEDGATRFVSPPSGPSVWRRRARLERVASGLVSNERSNGHPASPRGKRGRRGEGSTCRKASRTPSRAGFPSRNPMIPASG